LPLDLDRALLLEAICEVELFVSGAVLVDEFGYFYVEAAVLGYLDDFAFAPPADGFQAVAGLAYAQCGVGDGVEGEAVPQFGFDVDHQVEGGDVVLEAEDRVAEKDFVVEVYHVEADYEIGAHELGDEVIDALFGIDAIFAGGGAVSDTYGHAHVLFAVPAAGVVGGALGLEVEVDEVHGERVKREIRRRLLWALRGVGGRG